MRSRASRLLAREARLLSRASRTGSSLPSLSLRSCLALIRASFCARNFATMYVLVGCLWCYKTKTAYGCAQRFCALRRQTWL